MTRSLFRSMKSLIRRLGIDVVRYRGRSGCPADFSDLSIEIFRAVASCTMTSPERINALVEAVRYLTTSGIKGAMVECGVWKGGSVMAMMIAAQKFADAERDFYLYDTFSGMSAPTSSDVSIDGEKAEETFARFTKTQDPAGWGGSPLDEVKRNVFSTGYDRDRIHFIVGKVEDTLPAQIPPHIALLRLDTDWYESTKHELTHLYPLLMPGGVLIIDDYGHWEGARRAVDEYLAEHKASILLNRIDYTGRIGVKTR